MSALSIAGGIILFLIALRMIFPASEESQQREASYGEPFIVPLAIPLVAGPSAIATILLLASRRPEFVGWLLLALAFASIVSLIILLFSEQLRKVLGKKGLVAVERLMGMLLTTIAVQMFLNGLNEYFKLGH
jgi:small neutral amino acid transporter SnatA (MarC family)